MNAKTKRKLYQVFSGVRRPEKTTPSVLWPDNSCMIGLEIEAEGIRCPYVNAVGEPTPNRVGETTASVPTSALKHAGWDVTSDASVPNGKEFRFSGPLKGAELAEAIDSFFRLVSFRESPRAGIHVHVDWTNCDDIDSLTTLVAILCGIEPAIFNMVGHGRKENAFCKPLSTLPPSQIAFVLQTGSFDDLRSKLLGVDIGSSSTTRYYGANFASLARHGTVEFRYFPSLYDKEKITMWIQMLMLLRSAACDPELTPALVVERMSTPAGLRSFVQERFNFAGVSTHLLDAMDIAATARSMSVLLRLLKADLTYGERCSKNLCSAGLRRLIDKQLPQSAGRGAEVDTMAAALMERATGTFFDSDAMLLEALRRSV